MGARCTIKDGACRITGNAGAGHAACVDYVFIEIQNRAYCTALTLSSYDHTLQHSPYELQGHLPQSITGLTINSYPRISGPHGMVCTELFNKCRRHRLP